MMIITIIIIIIIVLPSAQRPVRKLTLTHIDRTVKKKQII